MKKIMLVTIFVLLTISLVYAEHTSKYETKLDYPCGRDQCPIKFSGPLAHGQVCSSYYGQFSPNGSIDPNCEGVFLDTNIKNLEIINWGRNYYTYALSTQNWPTLTGIGGCKSGQVCNLNCDCETIDGDFDGFPNKELEHYNYTNSGIDCNDNDPNVYHGAEELCNLKDDDCDGTVDEGGICQKSVRVCRGTGENEDIVNGICNQGEYCSTSTNIDNASCSYTTKESDLGLNSFFTFFCDNYLKDGNFGCIKFVKGEFKVCTNNENNLCNDNKDNDCDGKSDKEDTDCGAVDSTTTPNIICGNNECDIGENINNCPTDCSAENLCGNELIELGETCDEANLGNKECSNFDQFNNGILSCDNNCQLDTAQCQGGTIGICGDGNINTGETCDGFNLGEKTCQDFGFNDGTLMCVNCQLDTYQCKQPLCAQAETCNDNLDNDCNGAIDDGCDCTNEGATRQCGGPNQGVCKEGIQKCSLDNGLLTWSLCQNTVLPQIETCDNVDNDCDGSVDEGCQCNSGSSRNCGTGVGACSQGAQECINNLWSVCLGKILPIDELCNDNVDNDCDGTIDENCACESGEARNCNLNKGVCLGLNQTCANNEWNSCDYNIIDGYQRTEKNCLDKLDNDCDGKLDSDDTDCKGSGESCSDGTKDNSCSNNKPNYCDDGKLENKCAVCGCDQGEICRPDGSCIVSKPRTQTQPTQLATGAKDSDNDGIDDDREIRLGYNPNNPDSDGDGINDQEDLTPLCNENGICDSNKEYPETIDNCPSDCKEEEESNVLKYIILFIIILIILASLGYAYWHYNKKKGKKEEKKFPYFSSLDFTTKTKQTSLPKEILEPFPEFKKDNFKEHSNIKDLENYFREGIKKKHTLDYLRNKALNTGWYEEEVEKAASLSSLIQKTKDQEKPKFLFGKKVFNNKKL